MKKIAVVVGSPKSQETSVTYSVASSFVEDLKKSGNHVQADIVYLSALNIACCKGCLVCQHTGECVIRDDMETIKRKIQQADIVVFGSPVHFAHVSSVFQSFIERMLIPLHTFDYLGKPFINVVTTNGSGEEEADKYLTKIGLLFGCIKIGSIIKLANDKFDEKAYRNLVTKAGLILERKKPKARVINKLYFSSMRDIIQKNKDYFKAETAIWESRNWFERSYNEIYKELTQ